MKRIFKAVLLILFLISISAQAYAQDWNISLSVLQRHPGQGSGQTPSTLHVAAGQHIKFEHLSTAQGLSNSIVFSIAQDDKGFMWFGTLDGLNRYDGYDFKVYKHDPEKFHSLSGNVIQVIYTDQSGVLWIGTLNSGLNKFNRETEQFIHYQHVPTDAHSLSSNRIQSIYEDRTGTLWIGAMDGGLNKFDRSTERFIRYQHNPTKADSLSHNNVVSIYEDQSGTLWIGTSDGLNKFDRTTDVFTHYQHDPTDPRSLSNNSVQSIYEDRAGTLWIGTSDGLNKFDRTTEMFTHYRHDPADPHSLSYNNIWSIYEDQAGTLWISTAGGGLIRFDRSTERFIRYQHNPIDPHSLSHNNIWSMYEDQAGMLWIGTAGGGLNKFDRNRKPFAHYQHNPLDPNSLNYNDVRAIYEDQTGLLWIGTWGGGLDRFDRDTETFTHYQRNPADPHSLSHDNVRAIYEDQTGLLWIGTSGGLDRFERDTETFTHYQYDPANTHSLSNDIIRFISEDQAGVLWIGTANGLNKFDRNTETFTRYQHDPADPYSLSDSRVWSTYEDPAGVLWIGTANGLNRFDPNTETFTRYRHVPSDPHSLSHDFVGQVYEDRAGVLWIGTAGGGLNKLDRNSEQFTHYTEKDGLPSDTVFGMLEDDQGNLWISTPGGLSRFNPQTESFRNYDASDGLQSTFLPGAPHKSSSGEMFFGGDNGFNAFYPDQIKDNSYIPPVVLTDFQLANKSVPIGGDSVLQQAIDETDHLTLSYLDRVFSFEFAALNYSAPEKNRYKYKLEGFEEEWNEVDSSRRFVTYTNLDPGHYLFRVIGSNNDGVWNEEGASIKITVIPPWWETIWFRGSMVMLLIGLVSGAFLWQRRSAEKREHQLEMQVDERTKELKIAKEKAEIAQSAAEVANQAKSTFLANMSHELRSPLNAILGFAQLMTHSPTFPPSDKENLGIISRSGEYLLTLINDVMDMSKIEAGRTTLNQKDFDLHRLLADVEDIFRLKTDDKALQLLFERTSDVPQYAYADEGKLRQVLINLLSNALKFTETGGVSLRVSEFNELKTQGTHPIDLTLHFEIEDTGPGILPDEIETIFEAFVQTETGRQSQEGTGLGLPISRKFVQLMGGDMQVESVVGHGTTFKFEIHIEVVDPIENRKSKIQNRVIALESGQPRYRILIVDDRWENRQLLVKLLNPFDPSTALRQAQDDGSGQGASTALSTGFELRKAQNGQEAIEIWAEWQPHLIWMDNRMPVMDGYEATQRIRSAELGMRNKDTAELRTPIIALIASTLEEERTVVLAAGCDDFLRKPFREADLFEMMRKHIGVRFVYQEQTGPSETKGVDLSILTSAALAALPAELHAGLQEAVEVLDIEMVDNIIDQICQHNEPLAEVLAELVKDYQFDILQGMFAEMEE